MGFDQIEYGDEPNFREPNANSSTRRDIRGEFATDHPNKNGSTRTGKTCNPIGQTPTRRQALPSPQLSPSFVF